ncbi:phospholipase D family protein [Steroidobacter denitrificans]|uniref:phospholipase D family protein n=1 Tax=Steroidobacter denitrificans TaxID=465721 RepID=UPI0012EE27BB|nr:phospholipase D family protein [Steroidobacter denitrificans]
MSRLTCSPEACDHQVFAASGQALRLDRQESSLERAGASTSAVAHAVPGTEQAGGSSDGLAATPVSKVCLLPDGCEAFAVRVASARAALHSIDVQYYIWHSDATGRYLAHELLQAADRGVRVRVLLDDMDARSRDSVLVALNRHPKIQIRLFNPFATRAGILRTLRELFSRWSRLNHRMHNKSWIMDEELAIVGGRNIGDEYFSVSEEVNFVDMDVLLSGAAVGETLHSFETYWRFSSSVPVSRLHRVGQSKYTLNELRTALLAESTRFAMETPYMQRMLKAPKFSQLLSDASRWYESDTVRIVTDDPRKAIRHAPTIDPGVLESMIESLDAADTEILLISPYFVPGAGGTAALRELSRRGVDVTVLTNSLAATDVAAVHSGYSRYRASLLEGGVCLYELKALAPSEHVQRMRLGSSRASLHTKAAIIDRRLVFVGSFNIDPRSAQLNCEMGAWIDSEKLACQMADLFKDAVRPENSYTVSLDERGRTRWSELVGGVEVFHDRDPHANGWRRAVTWLLGLLPIESQL